MSYNLDQFQDDCFSMGVELSGSQLEQFENYYEMLTQWNTFMNLTAITDYEEVLKKHFLDSLSIVKAVNVGIVESLIDVGTGAGFPGIPLKIAFPGLRVVLLDSLGKRVNFLNNVIENLSLENVSAVHGRAEDAAKEIKYREVFDLCVSRAVANLSSLCEYCIPYTKLRGRFISYKSGNIKEEIQTAENAIALLGGKLENISRFSIPGVGERSLIVIEKVKSTPKKYPRKAGTPSREPL